MRLSALGTFLGSRLRRRFCLRRIPRQALVGTDEESEMLQRIALFGCESLGLRPDGHGAQPTG